MKVGQVKQETIDADEVAATDAARKRAVDADVDLAEVPPTGNDGQVTVDDVKKFIQRAQS